MPYRPTVVDRVTCSTQLCLRKCPFIPRAMLPYHKLGMAMAEAESRTRHRIKEVLDDIDIALSRYLRSSALLQKACSFSLQDDKRNSTCFLHQAVVPPAARPLAQIKLPVERALLQFGTPKVKYFLYCAHITKNLSVTCKCYTVCHVL